ncbi:MAG: arginine--tRNA ligase [Candidatus Magasanikbacteria bacterium]
MSSSELILKLIQNAGVEGEIKLSPVPKPEMGDLAFSCFELAKAQGKNPVECARDLAAKIDSRLHGNDNVDDCVVERVVAFGPYVNFFLNSGSIAKNIISDIQKQGKKYGFNDVGKSKKVVIEYPSNNTHKELHIGHLRNICIGNSLTNIFRVNGFNIEPINYLNDFGAHVAKCLWGLEKFHKGEKPPKGEEQKWLGEIYAEASIYLEAHPEEKEESFAMQKKLEARDRSVWSIFKKTRQWSIDGFDKVFKELGVKHNRVFYEQDVKDDGQKIVDNLLNTKIAQVGEGGAIIVDLNKFNLDIGLLRKSNGAGLYLTSDLGLAVAKNKKYKNISESIHLTGSEQNFYFKQLFKILELAGYKYKMTHIGYGLVMLPEGKMSSRTGKVVLYDDVRDLVYNKVLEETTKRHPDWNKKKLANVSLKIALAAIKFEFLKHEANKTIIFDAAMATKFEGFTGPYILYMVARINSMLRKGKVKLKNIDFSLLKESEEKQLVLLLGEYGEVIKKSFDNYNPSVLTKYSFDVAQAFSNFYAKHSVLNNENTELVKARLALCGATKQVLENCLATMSIEVIDIM